MNSRSYAKSKSWRSGRGTCFPRSTRTERGKERRPPNWSELRSRAGRLAWNSLKLRQPGFMCRRHFRLRLAFAGPVDVGIPRYSEIRPPSLSSSAAFPCRGYARNRFAVTRQIVEK